VLVEDCPSLVIVSAVLSILTLIKGLLESICLLSSDVWLLVKDELLLLLRINHGKFLLQWYHNEVHLSRCHGPSQDQTFQEAHVLGAILLREFKHGVETSLLQAGIGLQEDFI